MHGQASPARWFVLGLVALAVPAWAEGPGEARFRSDCAACHTVGRGDGAGPDLLGVTQLRETAWLRRMVREPSALLEEGDPIARELAERFKEPMPDQPLTDQQIDEVLGYVEECSARGGCALDTERPPRGSDADISQIEQGRLLFEGRNRFAGGGAPCALCHDARATGLAGGGTLGPDLTLAYGRLGDARLARELASPAAPAMARAFRSAAPTDSESFALRGFLASTSKETEPARGDRTFFVLGGLVLVAALALLRAFGPPGDRGRR